MSFSVTDKAVTFLVVEPLNCTFHYDTSEDKRVAETATTPTIPYFGRDVKWNRLKDFTIYLKKGGKCFVMIKEKLNFQDKKRNNAWHHFLTITHHKLVVMEGCFRVGLIKQGLLHDLSKYSWTEFRTGMNYYQGTRSPNAAEKEEKGYSEAWLHHKGRNKHHFEYWTDVSTKEQDWKIVGVKMPLNYLVEMVMDRIAASKIYQGKNYTDGSAYAYFARNKDYLVMHPETKAMLDKILQLLREEGESKTFAYLRKLLKKGTY